MKRKKHLLPGILGAFQKRYLCSAEHRTCICFCGVPEVRSPVLVPSGAVTPSQSLLLWWWQSAERVLSPMCVLCPAGCSAAPPVTAWRHRRGGLQCNVPNGIIHLVPAQSPSSFHYISMSPQNHTCITAFLSSCCYYVS